jgi:hypothetical protein
MKRFITLLALPLVLAACGSADVSYQLRFDTTDPAMANELAQMSARVMERRMDRLEQAVTDVVVNPSQTGAVISLTLPNEASVEALTYELTQPFNVKIMKQVPAGQGRLIVEGHGEFADTGIENSDISWGEAAEDEKGKGAIRLVFSPRGQLKLSALFKDNIGSSIGIFVRDRMVSKLSIQSENVEGNIVIRDIPNAELARIFVEDLNVGRHVTFTKLP